MTRTKSAVLRDPMPVTQITPFVPMSMGCRATIIVYVCVYYLGAPMVEAISLDVNQPLLLERLLAHWLRFILLTLPFIIPPRNFGWLHPLSLPFLFVMVKLVAKDPGHLLFLTYPHTLDIQVLASATYLWTETPSEIAAANLLGNIVWSAGIICYFAGYFCFPSPKAIVVRLPPPPRALRLTAAVAAGVSLLALLSILILQGGLEEQLLALTKSRTQTLEGLGVAIAIVAWSNVAGLLWFASLRNTSAVALSLLLASVMMTFVASGSRAAVMILGVNIVIVSGLKSGRLPVNWLPVVGVGALLAFGALGIMRNNYGATEIDVSDLKAAGVKGSIESALEESQSRRADNPSLVALARVDDVGYLYGKTYETALFFFVPRAIWPNKPKAVGSYNVAYNYARDLSEETVSKSWAAPVDAAVEAYWNFGFLGSILVFVPLGVLHQWISRTVERNARNPIVWTTYSLTILSLDGTGEGLMRAIQTLLLCIITVGVARLARSLVWRDGSNVTAPAYPLLSGDTQNQL